MLRKHLQITLVVIIFAALGGWFASRIRAQTSQIEVSIPLSKGHTFTIQYVEAGSRVNDQGATETHETAKITKSQSSDWSFVEAREVALPKGGFVTHRTVENVPARQLHQIVDAGRSVSTVPLAANLISPRMRRVASAPSCLVPSAYPNMRSVGTEVLHNIETVHLRMEVIARGDTSKVRTMDLWVAPSLGCEELRRIHDYSVAGKLVHRTVREATSVSLTEPDRSLFAVPAGYTEKPPSLAQSEAFRALVSNAKSIPECLTKSGEFQDSVYNKMLSQAPIQ